MAEVTLTPIVTVSSMTVPVVGSASSRPTRPPFMVATEWERALQDARAGLRAWRLWTHLGWQDVRGRYRRSIIGPFWMTITMATTTVGLGILFSELWHDSLSTYLPYIGAGLIVWGFIGGCLQDAPESFTVSDEMIKQVPVPFTALVLRMVWRQFIILAHNMVVYVVILAVFFRALSTPNYTMSGDPCRPGGLPCHPGLGWNTLLAIPGFALTVLAMVAASVTLGIVAARYRDIKPLIGAVVQLLFFFTPISWPMDTLIQQIGDKQWIVQVNPLLNFLQIVRQPLIGQQIDWWNWVIAVALTALAWLLAAYMMRRYRHRIAYWV